ncbi:hypothetical protein [Mangrovimonas cancribranchiae]|uniref:Transcriptional regulator n=1 Tax=Mangrovimonas cancribranchiae TaxID=3080055 RepID=A0AAU6P4W6_9FLAO
MHDPLYWQMVDRFGAEETFRLKKIHDEAFLRTAKVEIPVKTLYKICEAHEIKISEFFQLLEE